MIQHFTPIPPLPLHQHLCGKILPPPPPVLLCDLIIGNQIGLNFSPVVRRNMEWRGMARGLPCQGIIDRWGSGAMLRGWYGWGVECADGWCAFPLVLLPFKKIRNGNCGGFMKYIWGGMIGKVKPKHLSQIGWRRVSSHKSVVVYINSKSEHFPLERKLCCLFQLVFEICVNRILYHFLVLLSPLW